MGGFQAGNARLTFREKLLLQAHRACWDPAAVRHATGVQHELLMPEPPVTTSDQVPCHYVWMPCAASSFCTSPLVLGAC